MNDAPKRYRQPDRHVIRSINLREAAKAVDGVEQLDAVIEKMRKSLAEWPRRKSA